MKTKTGYSLAFLFLLTALISVLLGTLRTAITAVLSSNDGWSELLASSLTTGICAMAIGSIVGLYHYQPGLGASLGAGVGFWVGCMAGPLLLVRTEDIGALFLAQAGGACS